MLKKIIYPDIFHGENKKKNFFEGWYFKLVDKEGKNSYALIPGIFLGREKEYSHSFIQILHGKESLYLYKKYRVENFKWHKDKFVINVKDNVFSLNGIKVDIKDSVISVNGKVTFNNIVKWPDTIINPGSMGFYNYIPFMQCYSQVSSLNMDLSGYLKVNGEFIDFNGGKGYIEKNWGKAFPYSWIWVQCNNFKNKTASVTCSVGEIPFLLGRFRGFLIGLTLNNKFYKFTTMNRSKLNIVKKGKDICIKVNNGTNTLIIDIESPRDRFILCNGPRDNKMIPLVKENLSSKVRIQLKCNIDNKTLYYDEGICGGVEYGGETMSILG